MSLPDCILLKISNLEDRARDIVQVETRREKKKKGRQQQLAMGHYQEA